MKRRHLLLAGLVAAIFLAGCGPNPQPAPPDTNPDVEPTPTAQEKPPAGPPETSGVSEPQASIIEALRPIPARRISQKSVSNDRVRTYLDGKLLTVSLLTAPDAKSEFLVPIRDFYRAYDKNAGKNTVVYWVPAKRRVLVSKHAIKEQITIIAKRGYTTPREISQRQDWGKKVSLRHRRVDFTRRL